MQLRIKILKNATYLIYTVFTANLLCFTGGMLQTWSSPVLPKLIDQSKISENPLGRTISISEASWIGSLLSLGAMLIPSLTGYSSDKIGRKYTIILIGFPYIISSLILAFSSTIGWFYFARILGGVSVGSTFYLIPVYIAEISEKEIRGILGTTMNTFLTLGMLASFCIGPYLSIQWFSVICASIPTIFIVLSLYLPESPYYLVKNKRFEEAINVIKKLQITTRMEAAMEMMSLETIPTVSAEIMPQNSLAIGNEPARKESTSKESANGLEESYLNEITSYLKMGSGAKLSQLWASKSAQKGLFVCCMLMVFQQMSGVDPITYYSESIFAEAGTEIPPEICSIIFGATQVAATFVTPFFVDSFGRKSLLVVSSSGMLVSGTPLAVYFHLKEIGHDLTDFHWISVTCLVVFIVFFNVGYACIPYIFMAEIFPEWCKSVATSTATFTNWMMCFLLTRMFVPLSAEIGTSGSLFIFAGSNLVAIVFVVLWVPETKGKSFQEIQYMLEAKKCKNTFRVAGVVDSVVEGVLDGAVPKFGLS